MKDDVMGPLPQPDLPTLDVEQIYGALLGAAVGDALGWPYEQNSWRLNSRSAIPSTDFFRAWRRRAGRYLPYELEIGPGEYSDDTQLLLATARAVMWYGPWARYLSLHELPLWLLYERGGGGSTKRAAESWLRGIAPWANGRLRHSYFEAGGNGVAMRVLPHVFVPYQTDTHLMRDVLRNGILTHGHPRALLGARIYALAAHWLARAPQPIAYGALIDMLLEREAIWGQHPELTSGAEASSQSWIEAANHHFAGGYLEVWRSTIEEIREGLKHCKQALSGGALASDYDTLRELKCFDRSVNGSGVVAALAVVYLFAAHATNPMVGLRTIAYAQSADTDTLASMLGGLFGLIHRVEWIPEPLRHVQDHQYLEQLANVFTQPLSVSERVSSAQWNDAEARKVYGLLQRPVESLHLGILGKSTVLERRKLKTSSPASEAEEWKLQVASGQTVFVVRSKKVVPKQLQERASAYDSKTTQVVEQLIEDVQQLELEGALESTAPQVQEVHVTEQVLEFLTELAANLPTEALAVPVLRFTVELFQKPPESVAVLRELMTQASVLMDTSTKERYLWVAEKYFFPDTSGQTP